MHLPCPLLLLLLASFHVDVLAVKLPFHVIHPNHDAQDAGLARRSGPVGAFTKRSLPADAPMKRSAPAHRLAHERRRAMEQYAPGRRSSSPHVKRTTANIPISNTGNAQYISNITLGGVTARVLLDTGSSDLWVSFPNDQPDAKDLGKSVSLSYAVGNAQGDIYAADAEFGNFSISQQVFLNVKDTSSFSSDIHAQGYDGLLGIGPNEGSSIMDELDPDDDDHSADTTLARIFAENSTENNYITFLLDRKNSPSTPFTGQLTIGELVPMFNNITDMPKIDVETVHKLLEEEQHWQALTDKDNGIIGPDGNVIKYDSIVPKAPDGQLVAVFDSGFTFSQVPREVSDAIYGRVKNAVYDSNSEYWTIPCGQELNITFNFGGYKYPVHPLDTVDDNFGIKNAAGERVCIGSFQPITTAFSLLGNYDMIMGMSFLRNVYTLMDFGDWVPTSSNDRGHPFMQLLSVTDPDSAHQDFVTKRLDGTDTTGDDKWALLPESQKQSSPVSDEEKKKQYQEMILSRWPYILLGCLAFVIIVVGLIIWRCCCRRRGTGKGRGFFGVGMSRGPPKEQATSVTSEYLKLREQNASQYSVNDPHASQYSVNNASTYSVHKQNY
ncbi:acid protease [Schizophyllum commune Loenen D]|nr:acid protease [Schizophyllum commune Loenen D]